MPPLIELHRRLIRLQNTFASMTGPTNWYTAFLEDIGNYSGSMPLDTARAVFLAPQERLPVKIENMHRWLTVHFSKAATASMGTFGWSVPTAQALRWVADERGHHSDYYRRLAEALGESLPAQPMIASPLDRHRESLVACVEVLESVEAQPEMWSEGARHRLFFELRNTLWQVEEGGDLYLSIDYPEDLPPSEGNTAVGLTMSAGNIMRHALRNSTNEAEKQWLSKALAYYPDPHLAIELPTASGGFWITNVELDDDPTDEGIGDCLGSVDVDPSGERPRFSRNPEVFEFKLHEFNDPDMADHCLLASENVRYVGIFEVD